MVQATEEAITEITRNLVEKAIGHASAGSDVAISLARDGTLCVADHGPRQRAGHRSIIFAVG
jgi:hypothetical protein